MIGVEGRGCQGLISALGCIDRNVTEGTPWLSMIAGVVHVLLRGLC